jgi:phosphate transport system permease protein
MAGLGDKRMETIAPLPRLRAENAAIDAESTPRTASLYGNKWQRTELTGQAFTWLCGGALAFNVLLVLSILALLAWNGLGYFWQKSILRLEMKDGRAILGEVWGTEKDEAAAQTGGTPIDRLRLKIGNRDVQGLDFEWIDRKDIASISQPADAVVLERAEWGNFYGTLEELRAGGKVLAQGPEDVARALGPLLAKKEKERARIRALEKGEIGDINYAIEKLRLARKRAERAERAQSQTEIAEIDSEIATKEAQYQALADRLTRRRQALEAETLVARTADGTAKEMPVGAVLHVISPNRLGILSKIGLYFSRLWEFVSTDPRESNTEGGIFPAIFGTVLMVFLMSVAVVPLGVLAAIYLREYARQGFLVRLVRIAVNNLAGVPSIVFGIFGLGFFVYLVGGSIDRLFYPEALPTPTFGTGGILWASLTLALLTVPVVIVAAEEGLAAVPRIVREGSLALGATKFETLWRVVLPAAAPGILTGMILAMARAAGEVAPLMIVGMVKLAPALPMDRNFPFVHFERKFMSLGFHIYDVGFQSPNVEATKPLVFATALLLILVVTATNLVAISLRNHLRRKYAGSAV